MAVKKTRKVVGVAVRKGENMTIGRDWKVVHDGANGERAFVGALNEWWLRASKRRARSR
jgi:hypothetical protein